MASLKRLSDLIEKRHNALFIIGFAFLVGHYVGRHSKGDAGPLLRQFGNYAIGQISG